jgi:hypothetical protein
MLGIGMLLAIGRRSISEIIFAGHQIILGELKATSSVSFTMPRTSPSLP